MSKKRLKVADFAKMVGVTRQNVNYHIKSNIDKGYFRLKGKDYAFEVIEFGDEKRYHVIVDDDDEDTNKD